MAKVKTYENTADAGRYLLSEADGRRSREQLLLAALAANTVAPCGLVLGKVTATGKYKTLAPAAVDGTQNAAAILWERREADGANDIRAVGHVRDCEVKGIELVWPAGISGPQKTTAIGQLVALGIIVR